MFASLFEKLLTFEGRVGRLSYFLRLLALAPLTMVASIGLMIVMAILSALHLGALGVFVYALGMLAMYVISLWTHIALATRRYHDFGWSGKWQLVGYGLGVALMMNLFSGLAGVGGLEGLKALGPGGRPDPQKLAELQAALGGSFSGINWALGLILLGMWAHLQFRPGTDGENRYDGESRLPGVFGPDAGSPVAERSPAPAYRAAPATPARTFAAFDGQPRTGFGLKR
jgi:uncharacterized membrane protein YhaH (DUF805 family)